MREAVPGPTPSKGDTEGGGATDLTPTAPAQPQRRRTAKATLSPDTALTLIEQATEATKLLEWTLPAPPPEGVIFIGGVTIIGSED